jgi:hypothetical protein
MGVPGKLKTLLDRLTATRAGYLDNLDAAVSSRAAASTALTNATWTDAKSNKLTNAAQEDSPLLDVPISNGIVSTTYASNSTTSYTDAINYTGSGVLQLAACVVSGSVWNDQATMDIIIDGVTVLTVTTQMGTGSVGQGVGYYITSPVAFSSVPFKSSLRIRHKGLTATSTSYVYYALVKTS